jgi:hypothetical protein
MSESKVREFKAVEARAQLRDATQRQVHDGPRILDAFGRVVQVDDGILLAETSPMSVVWRVTALTPATERQHQGGVWMDLQAGMRVLVGPNVANPSVVLGILRKESAAPDAPGAGQTAGGIILSDPDGLSER